jgi:hypothetical protein
MPAPSALRTQDALGTASPAAASAADPPGDGAAARRALPDVIVRDLRASPL